MLLGAPLLLRHVGTGALLHAEAGHAHGGALGVAGDGEVSCFTAAAAAHTGALAAQRDGRTESAAARAVAAANVWVFE